MSLTKQLKRMKRAAVPPPYPPPVPPQSQAIAQPKRAAFTITIMADPATLAQDSVSISTTTLPDSQAQLGDVVKAARLAADFFMRKLGALEQAQSAQNSFPQSGNNAPPAPENGRVADGELAEMTGRDEARN